MKAKHLELLQGQIKTMAAYGDCGTGYIGTAIAYKQGGYEAGPASGVTAEAEGVLMGAIKNLLQR